MKKLRHLVYLCPLIFFAGCGGGHKNSKLAQNYYDFALLELDGGGVDDAHAYKKSLDYLDQAIRQNKKAEYLALQGSLLFKLKRVRQAKKCFEQALATDASPKVKADIENNYACVLAEVEQESRAMRIWDKLQKSKDYLSVEVAFLNQSKLLLKQGKYKESKEKLIQAINIEPNYLDAHYYLALLSWRLNDHKLSKKEAEHVLLLEPSHEGAKRLSLLLNQLMPKSP